MAVIDQQMPEMNGMQLVNAMRLRTAAASLPVVLMTSQIARVDEQRLQDLGIRHHMDKPVRREELLAALCDMLGFESRTAAAKAGLARSEPAHSHFTGNVLVAEDNATNQKLARAMLAALGLQSVVAVNGEVAVEMAASGKFDLILMDCQMPLMDGFAATAAIRALPDERSRIPILALTANALQGDEAQCLAAGMDGFLPKPVTLGQLSKALERWLRPAVAAPADTAAPATATPPHVAGSINMRQIATLRDIGARAGSDLVGEMVRTFLTDAEQQLARLQPPSTPTMRLR